MIPRCNHGTVIVLAILAGHVAVGPVAAQSGKPVDLDRAMLSQIKEAYRSVYEVPQDLRDELRSYYKNPTPQREAAILKEVRRLFLPTERQEQAILEAVRLAYQHKTAEAEARIYREIEKAQRLPEGTVPPSVLENQIGKLFARLDGDSDGRLSDAEMPEHLRDQRRRWDANLDGKIDAGEFAKYYQVRLGWFSEQVATGKIDLGMKRGGPDVSKYLPSEEDAKALVLRTGKLPANLPDWFFKLDGDKDGQIALYEWRVSGASLEDFTQLDTNNDGFITAEEVLRYVDRIRAAKAANKKQRQ